MIGGGVMAHPSLLPLIRERVGQLLAGYFSAPALSGDLSGYIVAPALDGRAGVLGALSSRACWPQAPNGRWSPARRMPGPSS